MLTSVKQKGNIDEVILACRESGVEHMLCVGVELESFPAMYDLIAGFPEVSATLGVHPCAQPRDEVDADQLVDCAGKQEVAAIGETGLDYFHKTVPPEAQQQRLRAHIQAARRLAKPLVIHTRDARADTLRILREERAEEVGGVFHCFSEDWDTARAALDLGFYISFSGIVTFKNAHALREVMCKVPMNRMLIETDAPYLAPVPHRGKENSPVFVRHVADSIAAARKLDVAEVAAHTTDNFYRLFKPGLFKPGLFKLGNNVK